MPLSVEALEAQDTAHTEHWSAKLSLGFARDGERTVLRERSHVGPLRVQRPFYPEADASGACHVYVLHPPGGVVGGDRLTIDVRAEQDTRALITTPAAQKLYRSAGARAELVQRIRVQDGAKLEWLPQETIAFSGARARVHTRVELAKTASFIGWEILCLGRPACDEVFTQGEVVQHIELLREDKPSYWERGVYAGGHDVLREPWGLHGQPVVGTFLCTGPKLEESLELARAALTSPSGEGAASAALTSVTCIEDVMIARYLGPSTEQARFAFVRLWSALREKLLGHAASAPRIWMT